LMAEQESLKSGILCVVARDSLVHAWF